MNVVGKVVCAVVVGALCVLHETPGVTQTGAQPAKGEAESQLRAPIDLALIEAPEFRAGNLAWQFPRGSRLVRLRLDATGTAHGVVTSLTPMFFAAADPQVSFDGSRLLFAGQTQRDATWQIWEVPVEGGVPRQVTHCVGDCVKPVYLPENEIAYTWLHGARSARASGVQVSREDGTDAHPITFGPGRYEVEAVLRSGRLLLSAESPLLDSRDVERVRSLYIVDPDGSGLMLLRQADGAQVIRSDAGESADGTIFFVQRDAAQSPEGRLAWIRPGALHATSTERGQSRYASVQALGDGTFVVSRRSGGQWFDLYQLSRNGRDREQLLYHNAAASSVQAVPIAAHPAVQAYRTILHPERKSGRIVCLDSYASKDFATGRLPGQIVRVRAVIKTRDGEKVLGEAPVERDGSFYATVPSDAPIRLLLIGEKGEVLKQQRSWIWVRGGEDRGCFGCHESQALAPENRPPITLQRFDTPTLLMGDPDTVSNAQKASRP